MEPLNWQGATLMIISVGSVLALTAYCLYRVFTLPPVEVDDLTYPLEVDTKDTQNPD
jgi:hypothetical protein